MKSTDFQIQIPKPCDANWNEMTPNEQGKFCSLCDKTVVDFTKMSDEEIKHFFKIKKKEERVCGHFYASQVVVPVPKLHQFLIDLYTKIETEISIYLFRKPALFGLGLLMTMVGCETKTSGEVEAQSKKDTTETAVKDSVVENIRDSIFTKTDNNLQPPPSFNVIRCTFFQPKDFNYIENSAKTEPKDSKNWPPVPPSTEIQGETIYESKEETIQNEGIVCTNEGKYDSISKLKKEKRITENINLPPIKLGVVTTPSLEEDTSKTKKGQ